MRSPLTRPSAGASGRSARASPGPGSDAAASPPSDRSSGQPTAPGTFGVRILGVSEVTRAIRGAVRTDPRLADLWVEGEIGRVTVSSAGHAYFALKDERNQLQCVWFRDQRIRSAFEAQAGLRVVAHGRIDLFEPQGALQLYVESIQPAGLGDLTLRFEALKARLAAEGLFDTARKRPLPARPATIAVITSPTGAVWKDICHVLGAALAADPGRPRRGAGPGRVGAGQSRRARSARSSATPRAGSPRAGPTRRPRSRSWPAAAGSLEDLWAFNDEAVVRAVVAHHDPGRLRRRPRGRRHAGRLRRRRPGADAIRRRRGRRPGPGRLPRLGPEWRPPAGWRGRGASADRVPRGRRPSDVRSSGSSPVAQLASARERVGLLLDRATRAVVAQVAERRRTGDRLARPSRPIAPGTPGP